MAKNNHGGLGKGLGALLSSMPDGGDDADRVRQIAVSDIKANRYQPRQDFDESALADLTESIKMYGVLQPVIVRRLPSGDYELAVGERRLRAAKLANLETVPAIIAEYNDSEISEIALVENIQREDLNVIEEAKAYKRLIRDFGLNQETIAKKTGRSRSHIANIMRLLKLAPKVQDYVANGSLSMGQAKPLLSLARASEQCEAAELIQAHDLSARQAEALVKKLLAADAAKKETESSHADTASVYVKETEEKLAHFFGTQVKIMRGKKRSSIRIDFYSDEDLSRIVENLLESEKPAPVTKARNFVV